MKQPEGVQGRGAHDKEVQDEGAQDKEVQDEKVKNVTVQEKIHDDIVREDRGGVKFESFSAQVKSQQSPIRDAALENASEFIKPISMMMEVDKNVENNSEIVGEGQVQTEQTEEIQDKAVQDKEVQDKDVPDKNVQNEAVHEKNHGDGFQNKEVKIQDQINNSQQLQRTNERTRAIEKPSRFSVIPNLSLVREVNSETSRTKPSEKQLSENKTFTSTNVTATNEKSWPLRSRAE